MSSYEKPQSPLYHKTKDTYFYPLTTVDQVIMEDDSRLNAKMLTVDILNANEAKPNGINADKLGGFDASEYVRKDQNNIVEVNYSVVGGTNEPAAPTQNMIWIKTDTLGRVFFGGNTPRESFVDNDVWIYTGNTSNVSFSALKIGNNYVNIICPLFVKQYINGTWEKVEAISWQDGRWVDWWTGKLYDNGELYKGITGGWIAKEYPCGIGYTGSQLNKPSLTFNDTNISASLSGGGGGIICTANPIDVSNFSTLRISGTPVWSGGAVRLCLWPNFDGSWDTNAAASFSFPTSSKADVYELEIDNLSGSYYIGIGLYHNATITFNSLELL